MSLVGKSMTMAECRGSVAGIKGREKKFVHIRSGRVSRTETGPFSLGVTIMKSVSSFILVVLAVASLVFAAGGLAQADVIAYDGFGTTGSLGGSSGGTGWAMGANWGTSETMSLLGGSLAVPSNLVQDPTGGAVKEIHGGNGQATAYRQLAQTISADVAKTWYVCFAYGRDGATSDYGLLGLSSNTTGSHRIQTGTNYSGGEKFYLGGSDTSGAWGGSIADTNPRFYVMKVVSNGNGTLNAYVKIFASTDTLPTAEPTTWDMQAGYTGLSGIAYGYAYYNGRVYTSYTVGNRFDEYRITTKWSDIVVPEPSTLALLASGLFGLLAYAWRKRK